MVGVGWVGGRGGSDARKNTFNNPKNALPTPPYLASKMCNGTSLKLPGKATMERGKMGSSSMTEPWGRATSEGSSSDAAARTATRPPRTTGSGDALSGIIDTACREAGEGREAGARSAARGARRRSGAIDSAAIVTCVSRVMWLTRVDEDAAGAPVSRNQRERWSGGGRRGGVESRPRNKTSLLCLHHLRRRFVTPPFSTGGPRFFLSLCANPRPHTHPHHDAHHARGAHAVRATAGAAARGARASAAAR